MPGTLMKEFSRRYDGGSKPRQQSIGDLAPVHRRRPAHERVQRGAGLTLKARARFRLTATMSTAVSLRQGLVMRRNPDADEKKDTTRTVRDDSIMWCDANQQRPFSLSSA